MTPELKPETQPELKEALALVSRNLMFHTKPTFAAFVDAAIVKIAQLESALNAAREALDEIRDSLDGSVDVDEHGRPNRAMTITQLCESALAQIDAAKQRF